MDEEPPEIIIYGDDVDLGDSDVVADSCGRVLAPRPPGGSGRWAALVVGAVLLFAFGAAVGSHAGGPQVAGTPQAATTLPATTVAAPAPTAASGSGSSAGIDPGTTSSAAALGTTDAAPDTTQTYSAPTYATDMCGNAVPVGAATGVQPLPGGADLRLVVGAEPQMLDTAAELVSAPLAQGPAGSPEYVSDIARGGDLVVAMVRPCQESGTVRFIEIHAEATGFGTKDLAVTVPAGAQVAGMIVGDRTPWATVYLPTPAGDGTDPDPNSATPAMLLALDGSSRTVPLPPSFWPIGAYRNYVVGLLQLFPRTPAQGSVGSIIQIFDVDKGGIVGQLGTYAGRFAMGDGHLLWEPQCTSSCEIHRYDIASGQDAQVGPPPNIEREAMVSWAAVSPDGKRIAMYVPQGNLKQRPDGGYQGDGPPAFSVALLDVETGTTSVARGIDLPWAGASVAFSADSQWLVVGVATRTGGAVVAYDARMRGPYRVASLPDFANGIVPLAVLPN